MLAEWPLACGMTTNAGADHYKTSPTNFFELREKAKTLQAEPASYRSPSNVLWDDPLLMLDPSTLKAAWSRLVEKVQEHDRQLARTISDPDRKRLADQRATLLGYLREQYLRRYPGRNPTDQFLESQIYSRKWRTLS